MLVNSPVISLTEIGSVRVFRTTLLFLPPRYVLGSHWKR